MNTLQRWTRPRYYIGQEWPEYYSAGVGRSRDSDALERANFDAMLEQLGGESDTVIVVRESHWAVGWVEWIAIHETDTTAIEAASRINAKLNDYPVIDEELWSRYEDEACRVVWEGCFNTRDRLDYLRRHSYTAHDLTDLFQAVRAGSWYHAANILHCPSEVAA